MRKTAYALKIASALIFAAILLAALCVLPVRTAFAGSSSYKFFVGDTSKDCRVITANPRSALLTRLTLTGVCGECAVYPPDYDYENLMKDLGAEVVFCEELSDSVNYYCTARLPYRVELYGREINLHICVKEDGIAAGTPIIFGGY